MLPTEGGLTMVATICRALRRRAAASLCAAGQRLPAWLKPATGTPVAGALGDLVRTNAELVAENAFLRQQLIVLRRQVKRPVLTPADRLRLIILARLTHGWRSALLLVQPGTLLRWHRQGFRLLWRAKSAAASKRPQVPEETVALIKQMAAENRLWGAERIRGELLKLGLRVGKRTVQRHMRATRPPQPRAGGQTWAAFVRNHAEAIWACDFLQVPDVAFRSLFAFFIVELGSRRVVHVGVTRHPTDAWVAQQLREATPFDQRPRYLIRDNDRKYGPAFARVAAGSRITVLRTPIRAPQANATCERFLGSVRRECLDYVLVLGEGHLRRVLREYVAYFNQARPHQGIGQAIPSTPAAAPPPRLSAPIEAMPVLGGLHHNYRRAA
jgi:putative transposase